MRAKGGAVDHPLPWLRYIDAGDLGEQDVDFDGLKVRNAAMERLGQVDGFIVDADSGRPYYVVVDSGGWFKSKHFLVPIGHAEMDDDNDALVVDLAKDRINRFPGFDKDNFDKLTDADIRRMNDEICRVCSITTVTYDVDAPDSAAWDRPEYKQPTWWNSMPSRPDRMGDAAFSAGVEYPPSKAARMTSGMKDKVDRPRDREHVTASARRDVSDVVGRAQPGDVIGLDTGGERTHIGETAADENKRREDAEEAARKRRD
jgi:hypothetical protein